jgi:ribosome biogenesis SPOUT family RNA methylase Rps3
MIMLYSLSDSLIDCSLHWVVRELMHSAAQHGKGMIQASVAINHRLHSIRTGLASLQPC